MRSTNSLAASGERQTPWRSGLGGRAIRYFVTLFLIVGPGSDGYAQDLSRLRQQAIEQWQPPRTIDKSKLVRRGFRVLEGRHVTLVTDLASLPEIDDLPHVVDAAVPLLAERFSLDERRIRSWRVLAMVIDDREKFSAAGLMPEGNEEFPDGLSIGYEIWVADQPSAYYRRHLLLHELVHSFMATQLGSCGPGWYMEAMAELLGTHVWRHRLRELELSVMPASRDDFPMWGRTKLVRQAVTEGRMLAIPAVMQIHNRQHLDVESYAWVWALAKFLDTHPRYRERFRRLQQHTLDPQFDRRFRQTFARDWSDLETEWRVFAGTLDYGYDVEREAIDFSTHQGQRAESPRRLVSPARIQVSATRGWQSTDLMLQAGERYAITASGRFVVGVEPDGTPWPSEPGGITLEYHAGEPLGRLLAAIDDRQPSEADEQPDATSAFLHPSQIGLGATIEPERSGVLYLRVNQSPGGLADNRGNVTVTVRRLP